MADRKVRTLLTGAAGRLGRAIREVGGDRCEWVCVDVDPQDDPSIVKGSYTDADLMRELLAGCQAVVHTALVPGGHQSKLTPPQYVEIMVGGLVTLLELCRETDVKRFVFSSSMEVIVGRDWLASGMAIVDERTVPNPDWCYPLCKLMGEQAGSHYHIVHGLEFVALRYMSFGSDRYYSAALLARALMTRDAARANLLAATAPKIGCEVLHIGPETPLVQKDILQAQTDPAAVVDRYWPGASAALRAGGAKLKPTDFWPVTRIDRARRVLGWRPEVTFESYLESLDWKRA